MVRRLLKSRFSMVTLSLAAVQALSMAIGLQVVIVPAVVGLPAAGLAPASGSPGPVAAGAMSPFKVAGPMAILAGTELRMGGQVERVLGVKLRPELRPDLPIGLGYGEISQRAMTYLSGNLPLPYKDRAQKPYLVSFDASLSSAKIQLGGHF